MIQWVLAATLVCGTSMFTACSNNEDNPKEQAKKDRTEFIQHTRQNLKTMAENMNFTSWEAANTLNTYFNKYVLNNPEFEKTLNNMFIAQVYLNLKAVEEGSELADMGYTIYSTIDMRDMKYRFTMNADNNGWDVEPIDNGIELIVNGFNPLTNQVESGLYKLRFDFSGEAFKQVGMIMSKLSNFAAIEVVPTEVSFTISNKISGTWEENYKGSFKNSIEKHSDSEYFKVRTDTWNISGTLTSSFPNISVMGTSADATTLTFAIGQDPLKHEAGVQFGYIHNGMDLIQLRGVMENTNGLTDFSQFTNSMSIADVFIGIMAGNNIKEGNITLLNDLTTEMKVSDCAKAMQLQQAMAHARRNYADQQTIDGYTQQLNELVSGTMTCKGVNQVIPMRLETIKFGVDYWAVPALNFADENGYVPITNLLDTESIQYMINIADHAVEPMQQSILVVRQLIQYFRTLLGGMGEQQEQQEQQ